ncbi:odorant-binding protein 2a isoform X2 [Cricetulus griseus]|uniref:Odorant-binding protein 2a isoform X2 n=1 Tax=Cricetulus griseus TaxID=10029 RepID=A0A9J7GCG1_CRIGR|nr:odorant-binding protein 2a isoform X2 [Cricetulus griseus]
MRNLLLTVLLLGLVTVLKAQEVSSDYQEELSGTWYVKAMVCDNNRTEGKGPKKVFPMTVTALEEGDLEVEITFWKKNQCHKKKIVMHKTDEPGKYTAFKGKKVIYIHELPVKDHYIFYCEGRLQGKLHRKGKLVGKNPEDNPEAMEEFKKFIQRKKFPQENIFVPEQRDECVPESN